MKKKSTQSNLLKFTTTEGNNYEIPEEGSLGLLAYGYVGLMAWRQKKIELAQQNNNEQ